MDMNKGLAILEVNDTGTKGFYIDQDTLECARLNAKTKKRVELAEQKKREAARLRRKAEKVEAQRRAYTAETVKYVVSRCGLAIAVTWAGTLGLVHTAVCILAVTFCLCTACLRLGQWTGRNR